MSRSAAGVDAYEAGWFAGQRGVRSPRIVVQGHSEQADVEPRKLCMSKWNFKYVGVFTGRAGHQVLTPGVQKRQKFKQTVRRKHEPHSSFGTVRHCAFVPPDTAVSFARNP